jgi:hypothetical protein
MYTWVADKLEVIKHDINDNINWLVGEFTKHNPVEQMVTLQQAIEHLAVKGELGKLTRTNQVYRMRVDSKTIVDFTVAVGSNGYNLYYYSSGLNIILCTPAQVEQIFALYREVI